MLAYQSLFDNANDAIYLVDPDSRRIVQVNAKACEQLGYTKQELECLTIEAIDTGASVEEHIRAIEALKRSGAIVFETTNRRKDGAFIDVEISSTIVSQTGERLIQSFVRDITERKKAARLLQERQAELDQIFNLSPDVIGYGTLEGVFVRVNPAMSAILGYDPEEFLGASFLQFIHPDDVARTAKAIEQAVAGAPTVSIDNRYRCKDGTYKWISWDVRCNVEEFRFLAVGRDVTHSKEAEEKLRQSEARFRDIASISGDWIWEVDADGHYTYVSDRAFEILGYAPEEILGTTPFDLMAPGEAERVAPIFSRFAEKKEPFRELINWNLTKSGERICLSTSGSPILDTEGNLIGYRGIDRDITKAKEIEEKLQMAANVFENANEGVLVTDRTGVIKFVNPAFSGITGYRPHEAIGAKPNLIRSNRHPKDFYKEMWGALATEGYWTGEVWNRRKSGDTYLQQMTIAATRDEEGSIFQYTSVFSDISEQRASEDKIKYQAYHDALTGLANRALFKDRLHKAIARAKRDQELLAVLFLDLDNFKNINDTMGHAIGDLLLQELAGRLKGLIREQDTVSRLAGDEFTILLDPISDENDAANVAQKIIDLFKTPFVLDGKELHVTTSVGVSMYPIDGEEVETIMAHADTAMYHAKEQGKNKYQIFDAEMNRRALERINLENHLKKAILRQEFVVYYQPQVSLATGLIESCEALVRWMREDGAVVSPGDFLPVAEETGDIFKIGEQVFDMACAQKKTWRDLGLLDGPISVNISSKRLDHVAFPDWVATALRENDLSPDDIRLEITESAVMSNMEMAIRNLSALQKIGLKISMDDFGVGYSSLSHLMLLPIDELKIDQSFVRSYPRENADTTIIKAIAQIGHSLQLELVAEGVETHEQLELIRSIGAAKYQGFHFSRPLPAKVMETLLRSQREANPRR